ncbi:L,D-transpeptidase family protein [Sphingomonas sp. AR_OL41]|uniref:L,D-transpeptidase family protein n=1 Tax=Sphingomonas sp. AR_OL41 TaxID=3042729 RepID=UPI002480A384|nr:L,D-transpeptidase family protein [Sphingomonas sp. AR_OL41]MDH7970595.1 L,D-transpeptidase family protein [Sphingomonas sp. AR_OL41]
MSAVNLPVLHVQVILDHLGFAPGILDGKRGLSLTAALKGFQESRDLPVTGLVDEATLVELDKYQGLRATRTLRLSAEALSGPFVNPLPKAPAEQAKLTTLAYRSAMEKLAEMFHTTPAVLVALNSPDTPLRPGTPVVFPNAVPSSRDYAAKLPAAWRKTLSDLNVDAVQPQGTQVVVDKSDQVLRVLDAQGKLVAQFTATMGSEHDPLPLGRWKIQGFTYNPPFHYNPALFWDARKSAKEALLPPGPNGPVGVIWLDLSKPHYGIHGTPEPSTIGRAESHGCIRLTNWDAARLSLMIKPGTPAIFQE